MMTNPASPPSAARPDAEAWLRDHGDALFRYALLHTRDVAAAEDAVQETLLAALRGAQNFEHGSSERTWLIAILRNKLIDQIRRNTRETASGDPGDVDEAVASQFTKRGTWSLAPCSWSNDPEQALAQREFWDILTECLAKLPARQAFAFCLRELEDAPMADICKVLEVSATNLWTILHRARTRLRRCLESNWFTRDA